MKKFFIILFLLVFCTGTTFAISKIKSEQYERRGCCSHHGGVCGCSGSRALCCDGSLSPSCGCY